MSNIDKQALREEFKMMQECYSDPADRGRQVIYIAAESLLDELEAAEKRITELSASHDNLREAMAGIHNTITAGGAYTPLAAILNSSKRAYQESAAAVGKGE
ncbi:TPA: hypothetical protein JG951_002921 [Enterobacter hormaechei subsp. steigerwaltii]|nr:hypothetical protein [Enterobacter hormaechei subsp. steigerwaltii]